MKLAYLDCASGISGDMTLGALVDAGADLAAINAAVGSLGLPGVRIVATDVKKHGFRAAQITIEHEPEHKHRHLHHIEAMIDQSSLSPQQRDLAKRIFLKLGEAEAKVHGTTIQKVHFHEVGAVDSIADIVGAAVAFDLLGVERVVCSPVPTGTGFIEIAHGRVSVPAPATGELLRRIPLAASNVEAELTTPTGAAIVATLAQEFGPPPAMTIDAIGYGAGQRDLAEQPNLLRVLIGASAHGLASEGLWMVETNLDDTSGEVVGYCLERLWELGALDVFTAPIQMKKNRPGVTLSVLCRGDELSAVEQTLFRETTTLGVRRWQVSRERLERRPYRVETPWGPVDGVLGLLPGQPPRFSPEFESCRTLAQSQKTPLHTIYEAAHKAFDPQAVVD
jgi:uncharacterized protein (TIGR00299 family) protein